MWDALPAPASIHLNVTVSPLPISRFSSPPSHLPLLVSPFPSPASRLPLPISRFSSPPSHLPLLVSPFPSPASRLPLPISRFSSPPPQSLPVRAASGCLNFNDCASCLISPFLISPSPSPVSLSPLPNLPCQGGGWCLNFNDCALRADSYRGSSRYWPSPSSPSNLTHLMAGYRMSFTGILSGNAANNPFFHNWNMAVVMYCDGGAYMGYKGRMQQGSKRVFLSGHHILKNTLIDLQQRRGMGTAASALIAGCSAGGQAVAVGCDWMASFLPRSAKVKCATDASFFLDGHEQQPPQSSPSPSPGQAQAQYSAQQAYASPQQAYGAPQQFTSPQQPYASPHQPFNTPVTASHAVGPVSGNNGIGGSPLTTAMAPPSAPSVALELTHGGSKPVSAASTPVRAHFADASQSTPVRAHQPHSPSPASAAAHASAVTVVQASPLTVAPSPSPSPATGTPGAVAASPGGVGASPGGVGPSPGGVAASPGVAGSMHDPPCAACKSLRRKCTRECIFLPYFPRDDPEKFARVHKVFGASNVSKMLQELPLHQREDAVASLEYEAQARVQDPVYGCVGILCVLQVQ
ncbi:unnamed protein product [Closterium sp. NIES-65]|nr:unnamed protein product [Closterium sp. NIES-65]